MEKEKAKKKAKKEKTQEKKEKIKEKIKKITEGNAKAYVFLPEKI